MRIIPGKTKVGIELFRGITVADMIIGALGFGLGVLVVASTLPAKLIFLGVIFVITGVLLVRINDEPMYKSGVHMLLHATAYSHHFNRVMDDKTLQQMKEQGHDAVDFEKAFLEKQDDIELPTKEERKAEKKARKKERKADDKLLRSHKLTKEQEDAIWLKRANESAAKKKFKQQVKRDINANEMDDIVGFTDIKDGLIIYQRGYYGMAIEIPPVEFRFFSSYRRDNAIENALGGVLRDLHPDFCVNIVKLDRPVYYDGYVEQEKQKIEDLRRSFENGALKEDEFQSRVEVIFDRINDLNALNSNSRIVVPFYYVVLYDRDERQLRSHVNIAVQSLRNGGMNPHLLNDKELAIFLKYSNSMDFDEREIENILPQDYAKWAQPRTVEITGKTVVINDIITYNFRITNYPLAVGDAWLAGVMSLPGTKVVVKAQIMDSARAIRSIDHSLQELRGKYMATGVDSKRIELANHIDSLERVLGTLQNENEALLCTNIYVTGYDIEASENDPTLSPAEKVPLPHFDSFRKLIRRTYRESGFRLNSLQYTQTEAFVGSQINGYDPLSKEGRGIPSNTVAAIFPWIYASISDDHGIKFGESQGVPVFIDFFRRDSERVNSNMVIVGKSGSGKSYATKSILTNLAAEDSKIFVLDPENEYAELAANLHGKFINVGNAQYGRLNPFQIITGLDDDEEGGNTVSGSYATHLQFLEEFFTQILPDCNKDALEYLNSILDRLYTNMGITAETDLRTLRPEDYPIFDDLYDAILEEFQTANNDYIRSMLRTLMNYISKFSTDGRNANIWNGPSTVTTEENFTVFNFQSLLANRNGMVANAQMLLVLKYIDNEIIKNREYNTKYHANRKVVVVIDEAHVFIDTKYPVALDFMFQLAKRIRKYNGMQIVITQNIKDFVGSEEIARKSTAIINACQYSFIFSLAPNDMTDLCKLYEKAGGINEMEQEEIISAPRGQAFTIMSAQSRSTFQLRVPEDTVRLFQEGNYRTTYFGSEDGREYWEAFVRDSRPKFESAYEEHHPRITDAEEKEKRKHVVLTEFTDEELTQELNAGKKRDTVPEPEDMLSRFTVDDFNTEDSEHKVSFAEEVAEPTIPAASRTQMPIPVPVPVEVSATQPAGSVANEKTEMLLQQMMSVVQSMKDFSYDVIMSRVQEMVAAQTSVQPEIPAVPSVPAETPALQEEPTPEKETAPQQSGSISLGSIFDGLDEFDESGTYRGSEYAAEQERMAARPEDTEETYTDTPDAELSEPESRNQDDEDFAVEGFDFMQQLIHDMENDTADAGSCLSAMEKEDVKTREITLKELTFLLKNDAWRFSH